ncbi:MAG: ATP synthase subunit I [Nitrosomonas sp.]|nr:MAG: ATP synthase subunit I [Nitrosomonas sp.]
MPWTKNRPFYIVLCLQSISVFVLAVILWVLLGLHGALSVILGGAISVISTAAFVMIISISKGYTADDTVRIALRAEAVKIIIIVSLLWLAFKYYENINAVAFIGAFIFNVLIYSIVLLLADYKKR